ncbi:MAG: phosphate acyltransferase PlsX [Thermodesulfobacteriota bacterium]|nr:phosphate acyltransferase PlsX [Thermodesulfobacteriota bacterium]
MNIAVDAMGGDYAPEVVVQGAFQAAIELDMDITLVGDRRAIGDELRANHDRTHIGVHHCEEAVLMEEPPLKAVRQKKQSSIRVAFDLIKKGKVDAVVSAGNSGASLAAGVLTLGRIGGVERPALATILPGNEGEVILVDVGANVDCRPMHLFQFGIMANAFASSCLNMDDPSIGLLSIGEEGGKGNEQVRLAHDLFRASRLNFVGNVEGRDIFTGKVQIIVCDGFVGNVALKLSEGMAVAMSNMFEKEMMSSLAGKIGLLLGRRSFKKFNKKLDYAEYGGALILGINGVGIVCHGDSSARAIKNAVKMASNYVKNNIQRNLSIKMSDFYINMAQAG